jgi:transcriptional repressor of cell division inhibition gene dicB
MKLTKQQAIALFGDGVALGRALGITKGAISQWPEELDQSKTDRVIGALIRLGKPVPDGFAASVEPIPTQPAAA